MGKQDIAGYENTIREKTEKLTEYESIIRDLREEVHNHGEQSSALKETISKLTQAKSEYEAKLTLEQQVHAADVKLFQHQLEQKEKEVSRRVRMVLSSINCNEFSPIETISIPNAETCLKKFENMPLSEEKNKYFSEHKALLDQALAARFQNQ